MSFAIGSLVRARGREWVVLPASTRDLLMVRPLGGTDEEITGILADLEQVDAASFGLPDPQRVGDFESCRLLYDAVRLGLRSSAGPFRSFGRIAVEPRAYQLVPMLMALRQDPVRLLIADDVGIGKTVEACLIAKELLERGEVRRLAVLCPPHLAEQWQEELETKFHIDAELVLASTASRLERGLPLGQTLFDVHPHVIVSMDFIKSELRRDEFVRAAPELVIIDEAHTCAYGVEGRGRHQRHELVKRLAAKPGQHLVLVSATPHSGKHDAFRSLLAFLDPAFAALPEDLSGRAHEPARRHLAQHLVQRMRADIRQFDTEKTPFPERHEAEDFYQLAPDYRRLFERVLRWARETAQDTRGGERRQRVRWWSALALLRALASSPEAAAASLETRASGEVGETPDEVDDLAGPVVLDEDPDETVDGLDAVAGADATDEEATATERRRLRELADEARRLSGKGDAKLARAVELVRSLLKDGFSPILFCRFIATSDYLASELRKALGREFRGLEVESVTGTLAPADREARVADLGKAARRVLVCTDCLSEGINLQEHFDAVFHYDLSWNPTRHEQRAGRVDRYNQRAPVVRVVTYYGVDNQIDGIVLDVLLRKHKQIRALLGVSVSVPVDSGQVMKAIYEGLLLRGRADTPLLEGFEDLLAASRNDVHLQWDNATEREKRSRTVFAQNTLRPEEVVPELEAARAAVGGQDVVRRFLARAVERHHGAISWKGDSARLHLAHSPRALRDRIALGNGDEVAVAFDLPAPEEATYVTRTHHLVEGLAEFVVDTTLDPLLDGQGRRCGAIRTRAVTTRTTVLLLRLRHHIVSKGRGGEQPLLAEECHVAAFQGAPASAVWLQDEDARALLEARPEANIDPAQASEFVGRVVEGMDLIRPHLEAIARERATAVLDAHRRVRSAASLRGQATTVTPTLPVDVLGVFVLLPVPVV